MSGWARARLSALIRRGAFAWPAGTGSERGLRCMKRSHVCNQIFFGVLFCLYLSPQGACETLHRAPPARACNLPAPFKTTLHARQLSGHDCGERLPTVRNRADPLTVSFIYSALMALRGCAVRAIAAPAPAPAGGGVSTLASGGDALPARGVKVAGATLLTSLPKTHAEVT